MSLRKLGLEEEYKKRGVPSLSHESYNARGSLLGSYGASVRREMKNNAEKNIENENNVESEGNCANSDGISGNIDDDSSSDITENNSNNNINNNNNNDNNDEKVCIYYAIILSSRHTTLIRGRKKIY